MDDLTARMALELLVEIRLGLDGIGAQLDACERTLARIEETVAEMAGQS